MKGEVTTLVGKVHVGDYTIPLGDAEVKILL